MPLKERKRQKCVRRLSPLLFSPCVRFPLGKTLCAFHNLFPPRPADSAGCDTTPGETHRQVMTREILRYTILHRHRCILQFSIRQVEQRG